MFYDFLCLDPAPENLTGSGHKVRIRPDPAPQHCGPYGYLNWWRPPALWGRGWPHRTPAGRRRHHRHSPPGRPGPPGCGSPPGTRNTTDWHWIRHEPGPGSLLVLAPGSMTPRNVVVIRRVIKSSVADPELPFLVGTGADPKRGLHL